MVSPRFSAALLGASCLFALSACGVPPILERSEPDIIRLETPPSGQLPAGVTPTVYRLNLLLDPSAPGFTGDVEIDVTLDSPHARIWLHALDMNILNVFARLPDGTEIPASFTGDQAPGGVSRLDFETPLPAGTATLILDYEAPYNLALTGLYKVTQGGRDYLASQMQAIDARRVVPGFDEPRFKTPWVVTVTAPEGLKVITNGAPRETQPAEDGLETHHFAPTRPIPSYLLGFAVGPYEASDLQWIDPAHGLRPTAIPLQAYAAAGKAEKLSEALASTHPILTWQEDYFGEAYPYGKLDLIAAPDFAWGAMENAGAIIYREAALLLDERFPLNQRRSVFNVHAHELAHQWFGNLVTPKWWNDIWLNEAFATWLSYKTMHAIDPEGGWDLAPISAGLSAMRTDSLKSARQIRNPIIANGDIEDAFDAITYSKGGSVLNMFETYLGEEVFREGIRIHIRRFADGVADLDDFMQSLALASEDPELVSSFRSFILQPGIPMLDIQVSCQSPSAGTIRIGQRRYAPLGSDIRPDSSKWHIPLSARIGHETGATYTEWMVPPEGADIRIEPCPEYVMPNAGGSGYWRYALDEASARKLAAHYQDLSPGEQMVYLDSLIAGFEAGTTDADTLLAGIRASVHGDPAAIALPFHALRTYHARLPQESRQLFSGWIEDTYAPLALSLSLVPKEELTPPQILLTENLGGLLLAIGDRPEDRARLREKAAAYIGFSGERDSEALTPEEIGPAFGIAVREAGDEFIAASLAYALASNSQPERTAIFQAVAGNAHSAATARLIRELPDMEISSSELFTLLSQAFRAGALTENSEVWQAFEDSFDALLPKIPEIRRQQIGSFAGAFCSARAAEGTRDFFKRNSDRLPFHERSLAQGIERATLCEAQATQTVPKLAAALAPPEEAEDSQATD